MRRLTISGIVTVLALLGTGQASAQARADTLRLAEALAMARSDNPMLFAARLRADAAGARVSPAGALPDPQLMFGLINRPLDGFGTNERMTMNRVQVTQRLPWPGKLGFAEQRVDHLARAAGFAADESEAALSARVSEVYYELAYLDRALAIMQETRDLLRQFLDVASTLYAVGRGLQQDVLQAQVSVARMTEDITVVQQNRVAMAARLNALLGRGATVPVGALELPSPGEPLAPADTLMVVAIRHRPALRAAAERVRAAEAGYRAARRALFPDVTLSVGYGQRPQFADMLTFTVGVSVPLWASRRQLPLRDEMRAVKAMEEAGERDLYNETYAGITEGRADAERARSLSALYRTSVIPQARAAVESALSAYRVGEVDFMTLVQNELTVNRYEIQSVRLAADYQRARARIRALLGEGLEEGR